MPTLTIRVNDAATGLPIPGGVDMFFEVMDIYGGYPISAEIVHVNNGVFTRVLPANRKVYVMFQKPVSTALWPSGASMTNGTSYAQWADIGPDNTEYTFGLGLQYEYHDIPNPVGWSFDHHYICHDNGGGWGDVSKFICVAIAGKGVDQCHYDSDCRRTAHKECSWDRNDQWSCNEVEGWGMDLCTSTQQCQQLQPGQQPPQLPPQEPPPGLICPAGYTPWQVPGGGAWYCHDDSGNVIPGTTSQTKDNTMIYIGMAAIAALIIAGAAVALSSKNKIKGA